jgi:lysozyme family protein
MSFETLIEGVLGREGKYANHPSDRGGETMWGITHRVARANGYRGAMKSMPRETAIAIYRKVYFEQPGFDDVARFSTRVADELFDTGINMGPAIAAGFLQEALNVLNQKGQLYPDIAVDTDIGPSTISALKAYLLDTRKQYSEGEKVVVLLRLLDGLQVARYVKITQARNANEDFMFGWIRTRIAQA